MTDRRPKLSDQKDSFDVGLLGCIRSPDLCNCFRKFLDEIGCLAPLNFLEAVETLHAGFDKTKNLSEHSAVDALATELSRLALRNGSADLGQITSARERQSTTGSSAAALTPSASGTFVGPKRRKSVAEHINRSLLHTAKAIYKRFFEDSSTFRSLGLHLHDRERLKSKLQALSPAVPEDADAPAQVQASEAIARVFDSCEESVLLEMERELYPRFQRSDDYVTMLSIHLDQKQDDLDGADGITIGSAVKDDSDDERAESIDSTASTATNATTPAVPVQYSSIPEDEATDQTDVLTPKFTPLVSVTDDTVQAEADRLNQAHRESTGWVNEEAYESIHIDVLSAKGLRDGAFGRPPNPYCRVTVGTTIFKNKALANTGNPDWTNDQSASHFEFPLRNTVSYIDIDLFDSQLMWSDKHLGSVRVHISPLIEAQRQRERTQAPPSMLSAMQLTANAISGSPKESNSNPDAPPAASPENGFNAPAITLAIRKTGDDKSQAPKQRGELKVIITFHKSKAQNPVSHKAVVVGSTSFVADAIRNTVSKKKKRFVKDGFDLDLSYITDRVIAMGFPSEKVEGVFRNNLTTVKLFFDKRHGNHYMIYNLCAEREYDPAKFEGRVCRFGFFDHNPCPFGMIEDFCKHVHGWLTTHSQHVAAIHCKAGKGRTGLLICCYMLFTGLFPTAVQSLKYYAARRTKNRKGVTIPSQIRYVHYYERYLRFQRLLQRVQTRLGTEEKDRIDREKSIVDRERSFLLDEKFDDAGSPPTSGNLSSPTSNRMLSEKRKSGPSLTKEQQIAARILGFRNRKMSVTERADVLDYLHMRNSRYPVDRSSPTPRRPMSGNLDNIPETPVRNELRVEVPSPRAAPVTPLRVVPASPDAAQTDEDLMSTLDTGGPVAIAHEPFLRGSYFLPDADKHHVYLNRVVFHGLPSSGTGVSFKVKNPDLKVEFSSKSIVAQSPLLSPATGPMTPISTASAPSASTSPASVEVHPKWDKESNSLSFDLPPRSVHVFGDVQFVFSNSNMFGSAKMFHFWLNTRFVVADGGTVILTKPEIDKVNKDKKHKTYPADFAVEVQFEVVEEYKNNLYSQLDSLELKYKELDALISNEDHHTDNSVLTDSVDDISLLASGTGSGAGQSVSGGSTGSPKHSINAGASLSGSSTTPSTPPSNPVASPSLPLSAASEAYVPHANTHRIKIETRQSQAHSSASTDSAPDL